MCSLGRATLSHDPVDPLLRHTAELGGATIDLMGGTYILSAPLSFPTAAGGRSFGVRDGTLRAADHFPKNRFLIELNISSEQFAAGISFEDVVLDNVLLDGARRGDGLLSANCVRRSSSP